MSLLMEALRKAEEAKRQAQEADSTGEVPPAPQPPPINPPRKKPLSQQSSLEHEYAAAPPLPVPEPDQADMETIAFTRTPATDSGKPASGVDAYQQTRKAAPVNQERPSAPPDRTPDVVKSYLDTGPDQEDVQIQQNTRTRVKVAAEGQKRAAAAMFAAKRTGERKAPRKAVLILALSLLLLPLGGAGYWYFTQGSSNVVSMSGQVARSNRMLEIIEPGVGNSVIAGNDQPASTNNLENASATMAATELNTAQTSASPDAVLTPEPDIAPVVPDTENAPTLPVALAGNTTIVTPPDTLAANTEATEAANADPLGLPAARPASSLSFTRSNTVTTVNPQLQTAYRQLQAGNFTRASQLYQEVLGDLPNNRDALLGLASVETRMGNVSSARQLYSRLLKLNPKDPLARTGLLQTVQSSNPLEQETELKALVNEYPDLAPLALLHGNFYAQQSRWSEAQAAYFNALLLARREDGAVSPDYAFNLAISLERLGQAAAALNYYRQASTLAEQSPPGFDMQLLQNRLSVLQGSQP